MLYITRPQEQIVEIKTPIDTKSINCKIIEINENWVIARDAFTILTEKSGKFYVAKEKAKEFENSGILKSLTKNSESTIIYSERKNTTDKFVEKIIHNDKDFMTVTTSSTFEKKIVKPTGMKRIGPFILIISGLFYFFLGKSLRKNELSEIKNLKIIAPDPEQDINSTKIVRIGFRLAKINDYFVVDRMDNGIDYTQIFKIQSEKFFYKGTLLEKSIGLGEVEYLAVVLNYSPRENEYSAEFLVKNRSYRNFLTVYFYKTKLSQFEKDYSEFFISQNSELLKYLAGILGKGYKILSNIK